jgi:hypothetical protein
MVRELATAAWIPNHHGRLTAVANRMKYPQSTPLTNIYLSKTRGLSNLLGELAVTALAGYQTK